MDPLLQVLTRVRQMQFIPGGVVGVVFPGPDGVVPVSDVLPFGLADLGTGRPVEARTAFEIGSLTKLFTATVLAAVSTVPDSGLGLDTELRAVSVGPVPSRGGVPITLEHLVSHRSGLPRMPGNRPRNSGERAGYRADQLWAALAATELLAVPGSTWLYSNFAFGILGTVLSEVTGRSFAALVDDVVCSPLGLSATTVEPRSGAAGTATVATGYGTGSTPRRPLPAPTWNNTGALAGSGALVSTGADMTRFLAAAAGYDGTSTGVALTRAEQHLPAASGPDQPRMGMAWQIRETAACGSVWFKNGGTSGMHCATAVRPRSVRPAGGYGVVVLTNGPDHVDQLAVDLLATLLAQRRPT